MRINFLPTFILLGLFINSCQNKDDSNGERIEIDLLSNKANVYNLEVTSFVSLETIDSSLIGEIRKIEIFSDFIYIFDKNGKFIRRTIRGKAPGECLDPWDFIVDKENNKILLWDQGTFNMLEYDLKLNYLKSYHYQGLVLRNFKKLSDNNYLAFIQFPILKDSTDRLTFYNYVIYNNDFSKCLKKMLPTSKTLAGLTLNSPISPKDRALFVAPFDADIYGLEDNNLNVIYKVDFGKYSITPADVNKGISNLFSLARKGERAGSIDNIFESENYLSFAFFYKEGPVFCIYEKKKKAYYFSSDLINDKNLPDCLLVGILENDIFISAVEAPDFVRYSNQKGITNKVVASDNPVIMFFKIKNILPKI